MDKQLQSVLWVAALEAVRFDHECRRLNLTYQDWLRGRASSEEFVRQESKTLLQFKRAFTYAPEV